MINPDIQKMFPCPSKLKEKLFKVGVAKGALGYNEFGKLYKRVLVLTVRYEKYPQATLRFPTPLNGKKSNI